MNTASLWQRKRQGEVCRSSQARPACSMAETLVDASLDVCLSCLSCAAVSGQRNTGRGARRYQTLRVGQRGEQEAQIKAEKNHEAHRALEWREEDAVQTV